MVRMEQADIVLVLRFCLGVDFCKGLIGGGKGFRCDGFAYRIMVYLS